jgi:prepilin-type N-terminal cleavage/methylation domain-containing protein
MKKTLRNKKGFTLVELMVVVAILGILVAIAVPVYNSVTAEAEKKTCHANQRTIESAIVQYNMLHPSDEIGDTDLANFLAGEGDYADEEFFVAEPKCPTGGTYTYKPDEGTVTCGEEAHGHHSAD